MNIFKKIGNFVKGSHAKPVNQVRAQQGKSQIKPENFEFDAGNWANGLAKVGGAAALGNMPGMSGIFGKLGGAVKGAFKTDAGKFDWGKLGKLGLSAAAFKGQRDDAKRQNAYFNEEQNRRRMLTDMALKRNAQSEPYRMKALEMLSKLGDRKGAAREYLDASGS